MTTPQNVLYQIEYAVRKMREMLEKNLNDNEENHEDIFDAVKSIKEQVFSFQHRLETLEETMNLVIKILNQLLDK